MSSSILNYRSINGRTYHSDSVTNGEYWAPNDSKHLDALEVIGHALDIMVGEKLHLAPITKDIKHAIDIGTGAGVWAMDFADDYPDCEVIGTDISPVQPSWCPPNLRFEIDDASKDWTFKDNHFDYIHIRFLNGAINDWPALYKRAYQACKPGGWIEHLDTSSVPYSDDDSIAKGSALEQYGILFREAGKRLGLIQTTAEDNVQENGLREAGFVNLTVHDFKASYYTQRAAISSAQTDSSIQMPVSSWPQEKPLKDVGLYTNVALLGDLDGVLQYVAGNVMGWSKEELKIYSAHLRRELKDMNVHGYWNWKLVCAQKPLE